MTRATVRGGIFLLLTLLAPPTSPAHTDAAPAVTPPAALTVGHKWSGEERETIRSLSIGRLPSPPEDPSNRHSASLEAARLGERLFFDSRFSADGSVSCGTCHIPRLNFTDALPVALGMSETSRRSMPLFGAAHFPWLFWDGRKDSLWSQALGPPESQAEHGISRTRCAHLITDHYKVEYEKIFGPIPDFPEDICPPIARPDPLDKVAYGAWMSIPEQKRGEISTLFANMGKAIAAYVRLIVPGPSRFDLYAESVLNDEAATAARVFTGDEAEGLRLFVGAAGCINCHNGPLFTNGDFHDVDVPAVPGKDPDRGRADGITQVLADEFNCLGPHSDAGPGDCAELKYMDREAEKYVGFFKTPSLRNVAERPPFMHAGQFRTLRELLRFYRDESRGGDIIHRGLTDGQLDQIEAFLRTLSGPVTVDWSAAH